MLFPHMRPGKSAQEKSPAESGVSWENILTSLEDAVIVIDQRDNITFFNQAAEVLTEMPASQALAQNYATLFAHTPWLIAMVKKSAPPEQSGSRGEGDLVRPRGREVPVNLTVSPLQDRYNEFLGTIVVMRDLTHRKELEEDLKRADRLAAMGTLAAGLAHEIKNPLAGIKGAAQRITRKVNEDAGLRQYADIIVDEVNRVNGLIDQLLDLSRPSDMNFEPLNIHEILDQVLLLEKENPAALNVEVRKNFDPSLPSIRGDRGRLTQVFLNLVKNAFQAMSDRGALTVTTRIEADFHVREQGRERGKFIRVEIEDQGVGIKEADLPHIFSPFFSTKNGGTGLGLAICYRIINEHGGLIRVESREGAGACFKVSLLIA
ncbi:MAG TPA: ATP-binding protein [Verrucomicrobiae bacterium]|jgi:two-component system, NtrC family, nitrogen regulation sensor histidine kinase GlnL|nr:ATP-binding protein [Verrucomicrobiae bacterium]